MKIRQTLLACTTVMLLTMSPVWAGGANSNHDGGNGGGEHFKAHDEIDRKSEKNDHEVASKSWKSAIAFIKDVFHERSDNHHVIGNSGSEHFKAPEIDPKPGKNPIAFIKGVFHEGSNSDHVIGNGGGEHFKAPEIDASSGKNAIALLIGALLLAGERVRSKRSFKSGE